MAVAASTLVAVLVVVGLAQVGRGGHAPVAAATPAPTVSASVTASPAPASPTARPQATPTATPATVVTVASPQPGRVATGLSENPACDQATRTGYVAMKWTPAPDAEEQRVALTIDANGFQNGNFNVSDSLAAGSAAYTWRGTRGAVYRWEVLTRHGSAWQPSAVRTFQGIGCIVV